tara:strand:+ start:262 stop:1827 length:1566 start_codon:yes stop_codon:yes gene_type:complete
MSSFARKIAGLIDAQGKVKSDKVDTFDSAEVSTIVSGNVSGSMIYYDTLDSLPTTGLNEGNKALVRIDSSLGRFYISNGTGWYNADATLNTSSPTWVTEPNATYEIADSVTPLTITALSSDVDSGTVLINQSFASDSAQYMATISNDSSVWTFTGKTKTEIASAINAGNLTDSDGDFVYTFKWSDGINFISKEVTITYNTAGIIDLPFVNGGDRGFIISGRQWPSVYNSTTGSNNVSYPYIQYFNTTSPGNASTFGAMNEFRSYIAGNMSNATRALNAGGSGYYTVKTDKIQYFTCATTNSSSDFGDCYYEAAGKAGASDGTKAIITSGDTTWAGAPYLRIDFVNIASTSNASNFGDLDSHSDYNAGMSDGVRCVFNGADYGSYQVVTAATLSDATTFGNMATYRKRATAAHGNPMYGLTMGGLNSGSNEISSMEYIVFQTAGNAVNWGSNLPQDRDHNAGTGNSNTAFSCGGSSDTASTSTTYTNEIYAISMEVVGNNATDFGDCTVDLFRCAGNSGNAA